MTLPPRESGGRCTWSCFMFRTCPGRPTTIRFSTTTSVSLESTSSKLPRAAHGVAACVFLAVSACGGRVESSDVSDGGGPSLALTHVCSAACASLDCDTPTCVGDCEDVLADECIRDSRLRMQCYQQAHALRCAGGLLIAESNEACRPCDEALVACYCAAGVAQCL